MAAGLAFGALGFVPIALVHGKGGLLLVVAGIAVAHLGSGPLFALGAEIVMSSVPAQRSGSAASMSEVASNFGATLGLALLGTLGAGVYRHQVTGALPDGLSQQATRAAHETVGGAIQAAGALPPATASDLLQGATDAFTTGLNAAAIVAGTVFVALSLLVRAAQRTRRASAQRAAGAGRQLEEVAV
jgi:DHA2 family multidrug resistance protein-like MFS transporter